MLRVLFNDRFFRRKVVFAIFFYVCFPEKNYRDNNKKQRWLTSVSEATTETATTRATSSIALTDGTSISAADTAERTAVTSTQTAALLVATTATQSQKQK